MGNQTKVKDIAATGGNFNDRITAKVIGKEIGVVSGLAGKNIVASLACNQVIASAASQCVVER